MDGTSIWARSAQIGPTFLLWLGTRLTGQARPDERGRSVVVIHPSFVMVITKHFCWRVPSLPPLNSFVS